MAELAMFPLGSVLVPGMPLRLRVFEQRYLIMLDHLFKSGSAQFGVVLIERGPEVGGGERRFEVGTIAEITSLGARDGLVGLIAQGTQRFLVTGWLSDAPHPRAEVELLPDLTWSPELEARRLQVEQLVRRCLAQASEFTEHVWPADLELSADPLQATWQLAGITPVPELDRLSLLRAKSTADLIERLAIVTEEAAVGFGGPF